MNIAYVYNEDWEKEYITEKLPDHTILFLPPANFEVQPPSEAEILSVFVNSPVRGPEMDRFPNLKMIATRSTGFDHIDVAEAAKRGIVISNVPSYGENTVAEFAFALLLALSRKIYDSYHRIA